jgi:hypothetical protein
MSNIDFESRALSLWDMQHFKVTSFVTEIRRLGQWIEKLNGKTGNLDDATRDKLVRYVGKSVVPLCRNTELAFCSDLSEELLRWLSRNQNYPDTVERLKELRTNIPRELKSERFLALSPSELRHYKNWREKWEHIIARFPAATGDIEEARKCYALSRYAATVFHTLQIVEFGIIELGRFIGVNDPKPGWDATCNRVDVILTKKYAELNLFEKQNRDHLEQIQGTIKVMKNAWRNKISHADGKLKLLTADLKPEIAEEILMATRAFMSRLAESLPPTLAS